MVLHLPTSLTQLNPTHFNYLEKHDQLVEICFGMQKLQLTGTFLATSLSDRLHIVCCWRCIAIVLWRLSSFLDKDLFVSPLTLTVWPAVESSSFPTAVVGCILGVLGYYCILGVLGYYSTWVSRFGGLVAGPGFWVDGGRWTGSVLLQNNSSR